jgi:WhiB family redox-sensing transcriptional regulator
MAFRERGMLDDLKSVIAGGHDLEWQDHANCKGANADLFFPERGASTRAAKAICRECLVRDECLEFAITTGEKFGIWGGMSERERRRVRRERQLAARRRAS